MSLDIWGKIPTNTCKCHNCDTEFTQWETVFEFNITHNCRKMAVEAGCSILWDYEITGMKAWEIIPAVEYALKLMQVEPERFDILAKPNKDWGTREQFVTWLERLLIQLLKFPQATLGISK